jgi:hypothetical protein
MKYLFSVSLLFFVSVSCSDWPTKDNQENEANPINITIDIDNRIEEASDNDTMDVDVDSDANSDSNSSSDSSSNSDSSSESSLDNSTGRWFYPVAL